MSGVRPYERILAGVDFRPPARDAAALGVALARLSGAELILAAVFPYGPGPALGDDFERWLQEDTERLTTDVLPDLEGLNFRIYGLGGGSPARKLHELAEDESADRSCSARPIVGRWGGWFPEASASVCCTERRVQS